MHQAILHISLFPTLSMQESRILQYILDNREIWYVCYVIPTLNGLTPLNLCKFSPVVVKIPYKVYEINKIKTHNAHLYCFLTVLKTHNFSCTISSWRHVTLFSGRGIQLTVYTTFYQERSNNNKSLSFTITLVPVYA